MPSLDLNKSAVENPKAKALSQADEKDEFLKFSPVSDTPHSYMIFKNNEWEGPYTPAQLRTMGSLDPAVWVCRVGSQLVSQAHEVSDLHSLIQ